RGHSLLESGGPIYPWPVLIWAEIARRLQPTLFLDIGANYGETGLSLRYRSDAKVYLFEPNPRILPYLKRSTSEQCNADQIKLVPAFVSDQPGVMTFKANKTWSGVSYGADDNAIADEKFEIMSVPAMTIDGLMATLAELHSCRLQFKIDVEGFERRVLLGMRRVLSEVSAYVGILEFDAAALARARTDARLFFDELTSLGRLWEVNGGLIRI